MVLEPVSVIKIAQMFKRCDAEPVRLVHDQQGARGLCLGGGFGISCHACQGQAGMPEAEQIELQPVIDDLGRVGNRRGEEESTAAFDGARDIRTDRPDRDVAGQVRAGRVVAGGTRLTYAGSSMTDADVAVGRAGKSELREARVLASFDERHLPAELNRRRHRA